LEETFPTRYQQFVKTYPDEYESIFEDTLSALGSIDSDDIDELKGQIDELNEIADTYGIYTEHYRDEVRTKIRSLEDAIRHDQLDEDFYNDYIPGDSFSNYSF